MHIGDVLCDKMLSVKGAEVEDPFLEAPRCIAFTLQCSDGSAQEVAGDRLFLSQSVEIENLLVGRRATLSRGFWL